MRSLLLQTLRGRGFTSCAVTCLAVAAATAGANTPPAIVAPIPDQFPADNSELMQFDLRAVFEDAEEADNTLTFGFTTNAPNGFFHLADVDRSGGQAILNLKMSTLARGTYHVNATALDTGGLLAQDTFTVHGVGPNEAPSHLGFSNFTIRENQPPGALVALINTFDPNIGDPVVLSLEQDGGGAFELFGNQLVSTRTFDFESAPTEYTVEVKATDTSGTGLSLSRTETIRVLNANDPPTEILISSAFVDENAPEGTVVGTLTSVDIDGETVFDYTILLDESKGGFAIDGDKLIVADQNRLNYSQDREIDLYIETKDYINPRGTFVQYFRITLLEDAAGRPVLLRNVPTVCRQLGTAFLNESRLQIQNPLYDVGSLRYTLTKLPQYGDLYLDGVKLAVGDILNQQFINERRVQYVNTAATTTQMDHFSFTFFDSGFVTVGPQSHVLHLTHSNTPPTLKPVVALEAQQGHATTINPENLTILDAEQALRDIICLVGVLPAKGQLERSGTVLVPGGFFSMEDVYLGRLLYRSNGADSGADQFDFVYTDSLTTLSLPVTFPINIGNRPNSPPVVNPEPPRLLQVTSGRVVTLDRMVLEVTDTEQGPEEIRYRVVLAPQFGRLNLFTFTKDAMGVGSEFTQEDINEGRVQYIHNGDSLAPDSFSVEYDDGLTGWQAPISFTFHVVPQIITPSSVQPESWQAYE